MTAPASTPPPTPPADSFTHLTRPGSTSPNFNSPSRVSNARWPRSCATQDLDLCPDPKRTKKRSTAEELTVTRPWATTVPCPTHVERISGGRPDPGRKRSHDLFEFIRAPPNGSRRTTTIRTRIYLRLARHVTQAEKSQARHGLAPIVARRLSLLIAPPATSPRPPPTRVQRPTILGHDARRAAQGQPGPAPTPNLLPSRDPTLQPGSPFETSRRDRANPPSTG